MRASKRGLAALALTAAAALAMNVLSG